MTLWNDPIQLVNGYDRSKNPEVLTLRPLAGCALLNDSRTELWARCNDGKARHVRFSGAAKTWKRRANIERPFKFGMYENGRATAQGPGDPVTLGNGSGLYERIA